MRFEGVAHVYGDNVDTDVIIPARYLTSTEPEELVPATLEAGPTTRPSSSASHTAPSDGAA